ncbi:MAG: B12-binding domain-containing radical SAM protein [Verrucomicrobiota bacterium]|nr:B12-binding domain-containing radical SAM protein [Verrucomicrobiota bacterium]
MKRIGFIAMSGVRAHNPELTRLGLTLPGFVGRNRIIASLPSLGLLTLAGLTPEKFHVEYHEIADFRRSAGVPPGDATGGETPPAPAAGDGCATGALDLPTDFDLVAISTFTAQFYEACAVADYYRARGTAVVMGGITVSSLREQAKEHCASVVIGEGELLWPEVLADFERGSLKPFYATYREFDLADAPMPRFDLLDPEKYNRLTVQTSRGCPHRCEFCASSILLTSRYKVKPVKKVIAEIREIKRIWPRPFVEFADDNSFVRREHYKRLLRELAKEKVRWFTEADVGVAQDDELLGLMRDSGCQQVLIGLESPRRTSLRGLELKNDWKLRQQNFYRDAIARIQSYGITVNGCFILGLDGDTRDVFDDVLDFVRDSGLYEVQVTLQTAFPGTPLYTRLQREGRVLLDRAWELCTLFDINFQPKHMSATELQSGFLRLVKQLYSAGETHRRRTQFKQRLKISPHFVIRGAKDALLTAA